MASIFVKFFRGQAQPRSPKPNTAPKDSENATHVTPGENLTVDWVAQDWKQAITHAKAMQHAIESFTSKIQPSIDEKHGTEKKITNDFRSALSQLNEAAGAVVALTQNFEREVQPLMNDLLTEASRDKATEITQNISAAQTQLLKSMSDSVSRIASHPSEVPHASPTEDAGKKTADDARKIKEGFEDILKGKEDPRIDFGKIPHRDPATTGGSGVADGHASKKAIADDAQKIKEGFDDILKGKNDPRMGFGRIPPKSVVPSQDPPRTDIV